MEKRNIVKNQKGFTLIEIIAVLVILGVLAAAAVPKYIDLAKDAKKKAALGQVAEIKSTMNLAYAKLLVENGVVPNIHAVRDKANFKASKQTIGNSNGDVWTFSVRITDKARNIADIAVFQRGDDTDYNATGTWQLPTKEADIK